MEPKSEKNIGAADDPCGLSRLDGDYAIDSEEADRKLRRHAAQGLRRYGIAGLSS
jgi:hypothetical protein